MKKLLVLTWIPVLLITLGLATAQVKTSPPTKTTPKDKPEKTKIERGPVDPRKRDDSNRTIVASSEEPVLAASVFKWKSMNMDIHLQYFQQRNESDRSFERRVFSSVKRFRKEFMPTGE